MLNGLLTLRGAWDRVREDPVLKFMVIAVTAYGMATFEGPMLSIKSVNALSHFTDWTSRTCTSARSVWNGFLTFAILYWLVPKLWRTKVVLGENGKLAFWIGTLGILFLRHSNVLRRHHGGIDVEAVHARRNASVSEFPRNRSADCADVHRPRNRRNAVPFRRNHHDFQSRQDRTAGNFQMEEEVEAPPLRALEVHDEKTYWGHRWLESRPIQFIILATVAILIGSVILNVPMFVVKSNIRR